MRALKTRGEIKSNLIFIALITMGALKSNYI